MTEMLTISQKAVRVLLRETQLLNDNNNIKNKFAAHWVSMIILGAALLILGVDFALADSEKQPSLTGKIRLPFAFLDIFGIL